MKKGTKLKTVYVFNINGNLIKEFKSSKLAANHYDTLDNIIRSYIRRKSCYNKDLYFSYKDTFKVPNKKCNHNPLMALSSKAYKMLNSSDILEADKYFRSYESSLDFC